MVPIPISGGLLLVAIILIAAMQLIAAVPLVGAVLAADSNLNGLRDRYVNLIDICILA